MSEPTLPDVAAALNRLLTTVQWLAADGSVEDLDNNVRLAREVSEVRGYTPHVHIHRIRQGKSPDPRGSVLWAICQVVSRYSVVPVTPDYFYVPETRTAVDRALDLELERLQMIERGQSG